MLVLALAIPSARADGECSPDFTLPPTSKILLDGEYQYCFKVDPLKTVLLQLDCGNQALSDTARLEKKLNLQLLQISKLEGTLVLKDDKIRLLEEDKERLYQNWMEENKKRHTAENKTDYSWIGWTAAAVFATSTVVLGAAFVLK